MNGTGDGHIFKRFDSELDHLHVLVVQMGELAVSQLQDGVATLQQQDVARAREVVKNDKKINDLDIRADDEIIRIIALRQPMARDLREIIALSKIIAELERAGDEARKIAGLTIRFYGAGGGDGDARDAGDASGDGTDGGDAGGDSGDTEAERRAPPSANILHDLYALAEYVEAMLVAVMRAFDDLDLEGALGVLSQGLKLDDQLQSAVRRLRAFVMEDARNINHFVDLVLGIRALERFGGHAKNIAGHIVFIKHGTDVRHEGVESILRQLPGGGEG